MKRTFGYCRISTPSQSIERQIRNIQASYPDAVLYQEAYTGTSMGRPAWSKLMNQVKSGDTIVFDSVSRMSRNAEDGVQTYMELMGNGVSLVFLKEPYINTETYQAASSQMIAATGNEIADLYIDATNKVIKILATKQIEQAFIQAQKEVDDLRQRTKEGMETARRNGEQIGQKQGAKLTTKKSLEAKAKIRKHSKDFGGTLTDAECMELTGIARNTYYKYKAEIRSEMEQE